MYGYGGGYEVGAGAIVLMIVFWIIGIVAWFYLNRASVRADRQIELLASIDKKLSQLIDIEDVKFSLRNTTSNSECSSKIIVNSPPVDTSISQTLKNHLANKRK